MKNILLIVFVIISACGIQNQKDKLEEIKVDVLKSKKNTLSNYFKSFRIVQLESKQNSLLSYNIKTIVKNDRIYVLNGYNPSKINVFTKNGELIYKLDYYGKGPGEFMYIIDFDVDKNGIVYLYCPEKKSILAYDNNGNFIERKKSKIGLYFKYFKDKFYFMPGIFSTDIINKNKFNMFYCLNKDMEIQYSYKKYKPANANKNDSREINFFWEFDNKMACALPFNDTLYRIGENDLSPAYYINFGKNASNYCKELTNWHNHTGIVDNLIEDGNAVHPNKIFENNKYLFFGYEFNKRGQFQYVFYDKNDEKLDLISYFKDDLFGYNKWKPIAFNKNEFVCSVEPFELKQYVIKLKQQAPQMLKMYPKLVKLANRLKKNDNPVFIFYKLK